MTFMCIYKYKIVLRYRNDKFNTVVNKWSNLTYMEDNPNTDVFKSTTES